MVLVDSNVWLALALSKHRSHLDAVAWLAHQSRQKSVLFCRATQQSFLRLLTTEAVLMPYGIAPLTNKAAWSVYDGFLADQRIGWAEEPTGLDALWKKLTAGTKASPKLWMDAYLAAFAMTGKFQLATTDKALKQFKRLGLRLLV